MRNENMSHLFSFAFSCLFDTPSGSIVNQTRQTHCIPSAYLFAASSQLSHVEEAWPAQIAVLPGNFEILATLVMGLEFLHIYTPLHPCFCGNRWVLYFPFTDRKL